MKCAGQDAHVNEIDLDALLRPTVVGRGGYAPAPPEPEIEERYTVPCRRCSARIVITREMVRKVLGLDTRGNRAGSLPAENLTDRREPGCARISVWIGSVPRA